MPVAELEILTTGHGDVEEALRLVFGHLDPAEQIPLAASLAEGARGELAELGGLFEARRGRELVGAVWAQLTPGKTAILWPPGLAPAEPEMTRRALLDPAVDYLSRHRVTMAQSLLGAQGDHRAAALVEAGFEPLIDLEYLICLEPEFPNARPLSPLQFEPYQESNSRRLADLVEETYIETCDCPPLCGVRETHDVLQGYQATGVFSPERWWFVRRDNRDVGCLLLTDHPEFDYLELLYMGLIPEARGNGWGVEVVRFAQWQTREADRSRLVLAVDADNGPALASYEACGMLCWDRRGVYWRRFS